MTGSELPLARVALWLYPPAWRDRYGDEVRALIDDSGGGLATVASVAWRALPAWIWPPRHLHDADARMRASLATVLAAWSLLTGIAVVFAQLTELQGVWPPGHPIVRWSYAIFDATLIISVLVAAGGGVPLWLLMLRGASRERRLRDTGCLLLPVAVPAAYLLTALVTLRLVHHPEASGPWWFIGFAMLGFAAAGVASAGPILAMRRLRPRGPVVRLAAGAAGLVAAAIALAGVASGIAATGLCLWARGFAGYHDSAVLGCYLAVVAAAGSVATVSAARGARAAFARPSCP